MRVAPDEAEVKVETNPEEEPVDEPVELELLVWEPEDPEDLVELELEVELEEPEVG